GRARGGGARAGLLAREFRPPTRFTRAAADATLALDGLAKGSLNRPAAAAVGGPDLLATYGGRLRPGYWSILGPAYRAQRGERAWRAATRQLGTLAAAARTGDGVAAALSRV